jgi:hypothetical protein
MFVDLLFIQQKPCRNVNSQISFRKSGIKFRFLLFDALVVDIVIIGGQLVDSAFWRQLDDAISHSVDEFVVV